MKLFSILGCALALLLSFAAVQAAPPDDAISPKLKAAFARAKSERVAVVGLGDSNQHFGGHGWHTYMEKALAKKFGCFGTGFWKLNDPQAGATAATNLPPEYVGQTISSWYLAAGEKGQPDWKNNASIYIPAEHPLDVTGPLRFHLVYGTFSTGEGIFQPTLRKDIPPFNVLKTETVKTNTGVSGLSEHILTLAADPARTWNIKYSVVPFAVDVVGPFYGSVSWAENTDKNTGVCYQSLYAAGGQSLFDMLTTIKGYKPEALTDYFVQLRKMLTGQQTCVVMINAGLNDRNEREKSIGPKGGFAGDSKEAFGDNLEGLTHVLQEAWIRAGGTEKTIHFALMPSHHLSDPDDAKLVSYRQAAAEVAAKLSNASSIDISKFVSYQDMKDKKYYDLGIDSSPHLSREGYEAISNAIVDMIAK